jgi:hypothetical protein
MSAKPERRAAIAALCCGALSCVANPAWAQAGVPARESAIKAAFLYKFAGFVEWPPAALRAGEPLVIGVTGAETIASDLEQIVAGRTLDGRAVNVRRIRDPEAAQPVHVLMVGATRESRLREIAAAVHGPVLIVTEQDNGRRLGGVLNFVAEEGRVRFTASVPNAEARGLRLSARLLAVAQSVENRPR